MVGHSLKQLKQTTHLSKLISFDSEFIHSALHTVSQAPQLSQSSSLILILYKDTLDIKPRNVPRGQIVLQNNLPLFEAITIRTDNIITEIKRPARLTALISTGYIKYKPIDSKTDDNRLFNKIITG